MHCLGYQKSGPMEAQENQAADVIAKKATTGEQSPVTHILVTPVLKPPKYSETELQWANTEGASDKNK